MIKISNKLIVLLMLFLIISACSSNDSSSPALVEVSSDEESVDYEEGNDDDGVYKSTDGGTTWEEFNSGLKHLGVFSLELSEENRILYAGTRAGGVYWISLDN